MQHPCTYLAVPSHVKGMSPDQPAMLKGYCLQCKRNQQTSETEQSRDELISYSAMKSWYKCELIHVLSLPFLTSSCSGVNTCKYEKNPLPKSFKTLHMNITFPWRQTWGVLSQPSSCIWRLWTALCMTWKFDTSRMKNTHAEMAVSVTF